MSARWAPLALASALLLAVSLPAVASGLDAEPRAQLASIPLGIHGDASIETRVRALLKVDGRFLDTSLELDVTRGIVELRGFFENPADIAALEQRISEIPGVLEIRIEAMVVARQRAVPATTAS